MTTLMVIAFLFCSVTAFFILALLWNKVLNYLIAHFSKVKERSEKTPRSQKINIRFLIPLILSVFIGIFVSYLLHPAIYEGNYPEHKCMQCDEKTTNGYRVKKDGKTFYYCRECKKHALRKVDADPFDNREPKIKYEDGYSGELLHDPAPEPDAISKSLHDELTTCFSEYDLKDFTIRVEECLKEKDTSTKTLTYIYTVKLVTSDFSQLTVEEAFDLWSDIRWTIEDLQDELSDGMETDNVSLKWNSVYTDDSNGDVWTLSNTDGYSIQKNNDVLAQISDDDWKGVKRVKKTCPSCKGSGLVKYYSTDYDYTVGDCTMCDGKGYYYDNEKIAEASEKSKKLASLR